MSTGWKDQEAWCLTIHGVEMRVLTSFFTLYLECVDGAYIHSTRRVIFWTVLLKFKSEEGRVEVIRMYHLYTTFGRVSYITLVYIESIAPLIMHMPNLWIIVHKSSPYCTQGYMGWLQALQVEWDSCTPYAYPNE